jgi:methionyl-tRNA synthetase
MVSGSDSHGAAVEFKAEEKGISPEQLAKESHEKIVETYNRLGFLYEIYTKTTTENHQKVSQNLFTVLKELNYLVKKTSKQYYDPKVERFLPDRYVRGTCPECGATNARGDECPECGEYLEPEQLLEPYSTLSDATPEIRETEHYYLDLATLEPKLKAWAERQGKEWRKWVREFSLGWLRQGLEPRPITRDTDYGIPVPIEDWEGKTLYVWFEAVIGYLSAAIEWAEKQKDPSSWEEFWKSPECKHYYFIAGGNVPFHTIIWPGELIGYNEKFANEELFKKNLLPGEKSTVNLNLPYGVPANNMLMYQGKKMSKGDGTGLSVEEALDLFSADSLRFFFARYAPEKQDREFIWKDFIDANNNELVANIGNFINRALIFVDRYFDGSVPEGQIDSEVKTEISDAFIKIGESIEERKFVKATEELLKFGNFANKYFNDEKPWELIKEEKDKAGQTLYNCVQIVNALRIMLKPFTPFASDKLREMLNIEDTDLHEAYKRDQNKELETTGKVTAEINNWRYITFLEDSEYYNSLQSGHKIGQPEILFPKFEYTDQLKDQDEGKTESLEDKYKGTVVAEIREKKISQEDSELAIYTVYDGEKDRTVVARDTSLNENDLVALFKPGTTPPGLAKVGKIDVEVEEKEIAGVTSEGMLASEKELDLTQNHSEIFTIRGEYKPGTPLHKVLEDGNPVVKNIELHKSEKFKEVPTKLFVLENLDVEKLKPESRKDLNSKAKELIEKLSGKDWKQSKEIKGYRNLHNQYSEIKDIPGSPEFVRDEIIKRGKLTNVNNVVDYYNYVSAVTGVSIGAHDLYKLEGSPKLDTLDENKEYTEIDSGHKVTVPAGEYAYQDNSGIICRLDTKQCRRTRITEDTNDVVFILQGHKDLPKTKLEEAEKMLKELLSTDRNSTS